MDAIDLDVLRRCHQWQQEGHDVLLIAVTKTWGSSPRPPGALMALRQDGMVVGSVSGGCIEDDLVAQVYDNGIEGIVPQRLPRLLTYGIRADEAHRFGLPCGGTLQLVAEPLHAGSRIGELVDQVRARQPVSRCLFLKTGEVLLRPEPQVGVVLRGGTVTLGLGPVHRLLVIGAGQLSEYFCQMAKGLGFDVTVCDPRREYSRTWAVPGVTFTEDMPDDAVCAMKLDARTAVVALTHDPKLDDLALIEALQSPAFYVGALGSRVNNASRHERLRKHFGIPEASLARLRGPAGLYIGSKTPPEIALSILAELVATKNGVALPEQLDVAKAKVELQQTESTPACTVPA